MDNTLRYLKFFETHEEYEEYMNEVGTLPNVSYCEDNKELHFVNTEPSLAITFNVEDDSQKTLIYNNSEDSAEDTFDSILVDGEEIEPSDLDMSQGLYQLSEGTHKIKYTLSGTSIGNSAFRDCYTITKVSIPNGVTSIGEYAFNNCGFMEEIIIPDTVTSIGDSAFEECGSLMLVNIPDGVTSIGRCVFQDCKIESIVIPDTVTSIGELAFAGCMNLTSINIPIAVASIDRDSFTGCCKLETITVDPENTTYDSRNNCNAIIETSTNTLIKGGRETVIPNSVTSISKDAFNGSIIRRITIPSSVTSIGDNAFEECSSLIGVTVEATTPSTLGTSAFDNTSTNLVIYVPAESVDAYKSASGWSDYASKIEAIPNA